MIAAAAARRVQYGIWAGPYTGGHPESLADRGQPSRALPVESYAEPGIVCVQYATLLTHIALSNAMPTRRSSSELGGGCCQRTIIFIVPRSVSGPYEPQLVDSRRGGVVGDDGEYDGGDCSS